LLGGFVVCVCLVGYSVDLLAYVYLLCLVWAVCLLLGFCMFCDY